MDYGPESTGKQFQRDLAAPVTILHRLASAVRLRSNNLQNKGKLICSLSHLEGQQVKVFIAISLWEPISEYGASPAIWDHTVSHRVT